MNKFCFERFLGEELLKTPELARFAFKCWTPKQATPPTFFKIKKVFCLELLFLLCLGFALKLYPWCYKSKFSHSSHENTESNIREAEQFPNETRIKQKAFSSANILVCKWKCFLVPSFPFFGLKKFFFAGALFLRRFYSSRRIIVFKYGKVFSPLQRVPRNVSSSSRNKVFFAVAAHFSIQLVTGFKRVLCDIWDWWLLMNFWGMAVECLLSKYFFLQKFHSILVILKILESFQKIVSRKNIFLVLWRVMTHIVENVSCKILFQISCFCDRFIKSAL